MHNNIPANPDNDQPDHPSSANHNDSHDEEHSATSSHPHNVQYQAEQFHVPPCCEAQEVQIQPTPLSGQHNLPHSQQIPNGITENTQEQQHPVIFLSANNHGGHQPAMSIPSATRNQKQDKMPSQQQELQEHLEVQQQQENVSQNHQQETLKLLRQPMLLQCPHCNQTGLTTVSSSAGKGTWACSLILGMSTCCLCCFLPFCCSKCKNVKHRCSFCKKKIGTSKYSLC